MSCFRLRLCAAAGARGLSLFLVEAGDDGFTRGRNLDKIGLHGNDTSELFFDEVPLPAEATVSPPGSSESRPARCRPRSERVPGWRG